MSIGLNHIFVRSGISIFCLSLCLASISAVAAEKPVSDSTPIEYTHDSHTLGLLNTAEGFSTAEASPFRLIRDSHDAGLNFDLGGSDTRKLQLQLVQPLSLSAGSRATILDHGVLDNGANQLGLDATLDVPLGHHFNLTAGVDEQLGRAQFHSLGMVHCMNGILRPDSYTASGCQFVNESYATSQRRRISFGARYNVGSATASISWFTQNANLSKSGGRQFDLASGISVAPDSLLMPGLGNPLLVPSAPVDPVQSFNGQTSGVNLDFRVGITTDNRGDIRLGLAFSRVLDANFQGIYANNPNPLSWTLAEPFNSARMNLEWSRGNFSSGIRGFYREQVNFLYRHSVDSLTTFDVHFTWKTPWKASLSVGAGNILNGGAEEASKIDIQPSDPLESVYGRIPYVRYKQDL